MSISFDNSFVRSVPGDTEKRNFRRQVFGAGFSLAEPTAVRNPELVAFSSEVANLLGLTEEDLRGDWLPTLGGNEVKPGMEPFAACYGGHQFGNWAGQLGDGRAISLGEVVNPAGERWEMQLKGAGPTPYSRTADGRAVMRSSVREFLCSEAMFHLGVPTTRALSLVSTGDDVVRDMFYDGNAKPEPGAVVCRVSPSFLRFGNFQLPASRGDDALLKQLADYTIQTHFPELLVEGQSPDKEVYLAWLSEVCRRTAVMVTHWMRVGFVHGVMNTDNMSVLGLTIDYGPYGWLDNYDPTWTPNTTDKAHRRYRFGNQPQMAFWNLIRFAESLFPLVDDAKALEETLGRYEKILDVEQRSMLASKVGLVELGEGDPELVADLFALMASVETDLTILFRALATVRTSTEPADSFAQLSEAFYDLEAVKPEPWHDWLARYQKRTAEQEWDDAERAVSMNRANPKYVLRNCTAQLAIDEAEKGDGSLVMELLEVLRRPFDEQPAFEKYAGKRPDWARTRPGCSMLSCSS